LYEPRIDIGNVDSCINLRLSCDGMMARHMR
jgi:hypothetical protein